MFGFCCQLKFQRGPLVWDSLAVTFRELCPRDTKRVFLQVYSELYILAYSCVNLYENLVSVHDVADSIDLGDLLFGLWACFWVCLCDMALIL